jgi:glycine/D-amino acid oxidase-like deaminating enzyme
MTRHIVKRLPVDTGTSGWEAISTRRTPVRELDGDVFADWLIVGAGFAGLSAARRLSQLRPGERIVVLDAREIATEIEENMYSACCENGLGTVKSTLAGVLAADLATGTRSEHLEKFQNQPAPSRLPPEPIAWLGINSVIW